MKAHLLNSTLYKKIFTVFIVSFLFSITQSFSQAGTLDSSFGVNGDARILIDTTPYMSKIASLAALQADGKIIVVGNIGNAGLQEGFILTRMLSNGKTDSTFGINGVAVFQDSLQRTSIDAIVIQKDGKIILGGVIYSDKINHDFLLIRYNSTGLLDSTFGINGIVTTDIGGYDQVLSLAIQADGKIVAAGEQNPLGCIVRYKANGSIDSSFGSNGIEFAGEFTFTIVSVKVTSTGNILTAAYGGDPDSFDTKDYVYFVIQRFSNSGKPDSSFGKNGYAYIDFYNHPGSEPMDMSLSNNDIIVVGSAYNNDYGSVGAIAKIKSNGILDSSFGTYGQVFTSFNGNGNNVNSVLVQHDGRIIVTYRQSAIAVGRFLQNGLVDSSFGINGFKVLSMTSQDSYYGFFPPNSYTALQSDGKIVIVGYKDYGYFNAERLKGDFVSLTIQKNLTTSEGNSGTIPITFKIVLNETSTKRVTVNYTTVDGSAKAGKDYVAASGTIIFRPGETTKRVTINVIGDNVFEKNERFGLQLSNPKNAILGALSTAICTIKNDDASFANNSLNEDNATIGSIKLYPNPAKDILRIEGLNKNTNTIISVADLNGKVLTKNTTSNSACSLNVKELLPGTYFVKIESEHKSTTLKFVKE